MPRPRSLADHLPPADHRHHLARRVPRHRSRRPRRCVRAAPGSEGDHRHRREVRSPRAGRRRFPDGPEVGGHRRPDRNPPLPRRPRRRRRVRPLDLDRPQQRAIIERYRRLARDDETIRVVVLSEQQERNASLLSALQAWDHEPPWRPRRLLGPGRSRRPIAAAARAWSRAVRSRLGN